MAMREAAAVNIAPLFLRLVLGVTFLWAGLGKVLVETPINASQATALAELGVLPSRTVTPAPADPAEETDANPADSEADAPSDDAPTEDALPDPIDPAELESPETEQSDTETIAHALTDPQIRTVAYAQPDAAAESDAASPGEVMRLHAGITLLVKRAASPRFAESGERMNPILPSVLANRPWPVAMAWAAAVTEIGAGLLVLFGFFTRLAALSLTGTIAVAMWLTQIGPVIQDGTAMYGFLPPHKPWYDPGLWATPLWQLALLGTGLALFFTGAGAVSVDRLLFKPKPAGAPAKKS